MVQKKLAHKSRKAFDSATTRSTNSGVGDRGLCVAPPNQRLDAQVRADSIVDSDRLISTNVLGKRTLSSRVPGNAAGRHKEQIWQAAVQPRFKIGAANDKFEREANLVASRIVNLSGPASKTHEAEGYGLAQSGQRLPISQAPYLRKQDKNNGKSGGVPNMPRPHMLPTGSGRPLDPQIRTHMESRFGRKFDDVKVYTGDRAAEAAEAINARAFTSGKDIIMGKNEYAPESNRGKWLLAHELTHVVQQTGRSVPLIQRVPNDRHDKSGLRIDGTTIRDWSSALLKIASLHIAAETGITSSRISGIEKWYELSKNKDRAPIWMDILIEAVSLAVSASIAGFGALVTAYITTKAATKFAKQAAIHSISVATDIAKSIAKQKASVAVNNAITRGTADGRLVFKWAMENNVKQASEKEFNELTSDLDKIADDSGEQKWQTLQILHDTLKESRDQAESLQFAQTVEGWMRYSAHADVGVDIRIGRTTLARLYRQGLLSLQQMQGTRGSLLLNPNLDRLPSGHQTALGTALGTGWKNLPVEKVTHSELLASRGVEIGRTSSIGAIQIHLETPEEGGNPKIDYVRIESSIGINDNTRQYFLRSEKKLEEFAVPKILVASVWESMKSADFAVAFDEHNNAAIRTGESPNWLEMYGARKVGSWVAGKPWRFNERQSRSFQESAIAFLRHEILGRTLSEHGVREIED